MRPRPAGLAQPPDELDDALRCVLALVGTDLGRARAGVSLAVGAMAQHLPRYPRSSPQLETCSG